MINNKQGLSTSKQKNDKKVSAAKIRKNYLTPKEINFIISKSGFLSIRPFLLDVLKKSRKQDISSAELLELQGEIAIKRIKCEKQIKLFRKIADREKRNKEWLSLEIYKAHVRLLKQVMDGIAFRFLGFNRPYLRQLITHNKTGFLEDSFLDELIKTEEIINKTGFYVILNDLTNFLRYGDLTIISPEKIMIDEVKRTGKEKGTQKKKLDELISRLQNKLIKIGDQTAKYVKIEGKPTSFLDQVKTIIEHSKISDYGVCAERVSPYLWVSSVYLPKMEQYYKKNKKLPPFPKQPFNVKDISAPYNSLTFFDEVSPNIMPYTTFPLIEEDVVDIMIGQIQLKSVVNEKELLNSIRGKGWKVEKPSREKYLEAYDLDDFEMIKSSVNSTSNCYTLSKGNFNNIVPAENFLRIESEFCSVKTIIDESEALMKIPVGERKSGYVVTGFSKESSIWI